MNRTAAGWATAGIGVVVSAVGAILVRRNTPDCRLFDLKVQFAGSDARLARWLGSCTPDLAAVKTAVRWDYLLLIGYGSVGVGLLVVLASAAAALPMWTIAVPAVAAAADALEDALLLTTLGVRLNRFAFPVDSPLPVLIAVAASVKFLALVGSIVLIIVGTALAVRRGLVRAA